MFNRGLIEQKRATTAIVPWPVRVLVLDDSSLVRETVNAVLTDQGFHVESAEDGITGVEQFHRNPAEIVIADVEMLDRQGGEAISALKKDYPHLKIIAVSGKWAAQNKLFLSLAEKLGADVTLSKPFRANEIIGAIFGVLYEKA